MRRIVGWMTIAFLLVVLTVLVRFNFRRQRMAHLFATATSLTGDSEQVAAVKELGKYSDRRAGDLLLNIAVSKDGSLLNNAAKEASIRVLTERKGRDYSGPLALLIQPSDGLDSRKLATEYLVRNGCSIECVAAVLHYKERLWRGELRYEDGFPIVVDSTRQDQIAVESKLDTVLIRNEEKTLAVLNEVYGLGTSTPSPFAAALVGRLKLTSACHLLVESQQILQRIPTYHQPIELQSAMSELGC